MQEPMYATHNIFSLRGGDGIAVSRDPIDDSGPSTRYIACLAGLSRHPGIEFDRPPTAPEDLLAVVMAERCDVFVTPLPGAKEMLGDGLVASGAAVGEWREVVVMVDERTVAETAVVQTFAERWEE